MNGEAAQPAHCWLNFHVYHTDLTTLAMECVYPFLQRVGGVLENCFWERHYLGGPHLRVRMLGRPAILEQVAAQFVNEAQRYLRSHPSRRQANCSAESMRALLAAENTAEGSQTILPYHVNEILEVPYQRLKHNLASHEAARLLENYLHESMPLVASICRSPGSIRIQVLRMYFWHALFVCGEIPRGCVSYKSHWEGFASRIPARSVVWRIKRQYEQQREQIAGIMLAVHRLYQEKRVHDDPVLCAWQMLLANYKDSALSYLEAGIHLTSQLETVEAVSQAKADILSTMVDDSEFMTTLFEDERFLALIQFDHNFLWPRVLTNLLYLTVASVGLHIIDKMALCYYAHRAAEEYFRCDLVGHLRETMKTVTTQHQHRLVH